MSPCLSNADFIAFDEGKLDAPSQAKVREHLKSCESCSHLYEGFRKQAAYTIAVPPSNPRLTIPSPATAAPAHAQDDEAARHYPKIEGYRILGVLGQGGMGIVYRAVGW